MAGPTHSRQSVENLASHVGERMARQPLAAPATPQPANSVWPAIKPPPVVATRRHGLDERPPRRPTTPTPPVARTEAPVAPEPAAIPTTTAPRRKGVWFWLRLSLAIAFILAAIYAAALAWFPPPWWAPRIAAHVTKVVDGDTIAVQTPGFRPKTIRLAQIDAPERRQAGGAGSRAALKNLVMDRDVDVYVTGQDRYGRLIAQVRLDGRDVARDMARKGQAWAYWSYLDDPVVPLLEWRAWLAGTGIWEETRFGQQAPWDYRAERRRKAAELAARRKARARH